MRWPHDIKLNRICDTMSARRGLRELLSLTSKHIGACEGSIVYKASSLHTTSRAIHSTNQSVGSGEFRHGMGRQMQSLRGFASGTGMTLCGLLCEFYLIIYVVNYRKWKRSGL